MEARDDEDVEWLAAAVRAIDDSLDSLGRTHPLRAREWRRLLVARLTQVAAERQSRRLRTRRRTTPVD